jgi:hypothetical protein
MEQLFDRQSASRHDRQYHRRVDHGRGGLLVRLLAKEGALTTCLSQAGTGLLLQLHQSGTAAELNTPAPRYPNRAAILKSPKRARHRLDGQAEIIRNVLARHRQLDQVSGRRPAFRHFEEKPDDTLLGAFAGQQQNSVLHTRQFTRREQ